MTSKFLLLAGSAMIVATPAVAQEAARTPSPAPNAAEPAQDASKAQDPGQDVVVTARKRREVLQDVPVAATAVTGETIERRGLTSVRDIAALTPGLNINSDAAGRAFVSIRGVGVTLVDTVQPGVGIFIDGIYQQNTSYLNNPLVDVERVEVLRGPQGTLYGKNTLGGAINIITRQPSNQLEVRANASLAGPDNAWFASGSVSGPIVRDRTARKPNAGWPSTSTRRSVPFCGDRTPTSPRESSLAIALEVAPRCGQLCCAAVAYRAVQQR